MKELGTGPTSSPGPMPRALRARIKASVPLATPMASPAPQKVANSSSKAATSGPMMKELRSMTPAMAASMSLRKAWCCRLRSANGTRIDGLLQVVGKLADVLDDARRIADDDLTGGDGVAREGGGAHPRRGARAGAG